MSIKKLTARLHTTVNKRLGDTFTYKPVGGEDIPGCNITIDRNKAVTNDYGVLAGFQIEASILTAEVPRVYQDDTFTDGEKTYRIGIILREFDNKTYVEVVEV